MTKVTEEMMRYAVSRVVLEGFRGFRYSHCFDFDLGKQNLAIFAPNGFGKTGFPDGFEFVTSMDGTIERIGEDKNLNLNKAGFHALKNVLTDLDKKDSFVQLEVEKVVDEVDEHSKQSKSKKKEQKSTKFQFKRIVGKPTKRKLKGFRIFQSELNVSSLIRGDELKSFVTDQSAVQRFKEACRFTGQEKAFIALNTSRTSLVKTSLLLKHVNEEILELNSEFAIHSNQNVRKFDEEQILLYLNKEVLAPLDQKLRLSKLDLQDPTYLKLCSKLNKLEQPKKDKVNNSSHEQVLHLRKIISKVVKFYCIQLKFDS